MPAARGLWGLSCWNALSPEQQDCLRNVGVLQIGYTYEGTECDRGAEIGIERPYRGDEKPGPRFYCLPCALNYITELLEGT